jgi:hypothetical protein
MAQLLVGVTRDEKKQLHTRLEVKEVVRSRCCAPIRRVGRGPGSG